MKRLVSIVLVAIMVLALASCNSSGPAAKEDAPTFEQLLAMDWAQIEEQAKKEGKVVYWTWHDEDFWQKLAAAFTAKYGVEVELVVSEKNAGVDKALAEKDGARGSFDVMKVGGEQTKTTMDAGLYSGPILAKMQNNEKLDPGLSVRQEGVEIKGYLVPLHLNQTGLLYNPATVSNPPQTWAELEAWIDANPKKFGFNVPANGGSGQAFVHAVIAQTTGGLDQYYGDTEVDPAKAEKWSAVWDWINERKDKVTFTTSNNDSISRLNQGELDLIVAWDDNSYRTMNAGELFKEAKLYIPPFGMAGGGDTAGIMKNAQHPAAALLFINFMISDEGQRMFVEEMKTYPARTDIPTAYSLIDPAQMQYRIAWIPAAYKGKFIEDFNKYVMMG